MKKPYTNDTDKIVHIGNCTIWPGQTREVEETLIPGFVQESSGEEEQDTALEDALVALLDGSVAEIREALPGLPGEHLDLLETLEASDNGGKGRKGVAEAIAEERLRRAAQAELDAFRDSLAGLDEEALLAKLDEVGGDIERQEIVQQAIEALTPGEEEQEQD